MGIETVHPDFLDNEKDWCMMRDLINNKYKKYILPCEFWLGYPNTEPPAKIKHRNERYTELARYCNFTLATKNGLLGTALAKKYTLSLPPELDYIEKEATGNKLNLEQLVRKVAGELLEVGRVGLFVDMPMVSIGMTGAETKILDPRARMYPYETENIRNWESTEVKGVEQLGWLVLRETKLTRVNTYDWEQADQYRILEINNNNKYQVTVRDKNDQIVINTVIPRAKGKQLETIPFYIAGADDNDYKVDKPPLWPIAHLSIGHVRNSAGYEDNLDAHGQCTLGITSDLSWNEWKKANPGKTLKLGSREGYFLGKTGALTGYQLGPNQEAAKAMTQKEHQIIMQGGDIILPASANAPVVTTQIHTGSKVSKLDNIISNTEDLIRNGLKACAIYMGGDPDKVMFTLSHSFIQEIADAAMARELAAWWVQGLVSKSVVRDYGKKVGLLAQDINYEEMDEEINKEKALDMANNITLPPNNIPSLPQGKDATFDDNEDTEL